MIISKIPRLQRLVMAGGLAYAFGMKPYFRVLGAYAHSHLRNSKGKTIVKYHMHHYDCQVSSCIIMIVKYHARIIMITRPQSGCSGQHRPTLLYVLTGRQGPEDSPTVMTLLMMLMMRMMKNMSKNMNRNMMKISWQYEKNMMKIWTTNYEYMKKNKKPPEPCNHRAWQARCQSSELQGGGNQAQGRGWKYDCYAHDGHYCDGIYDEG